MKGQYKTKEWIAMHKAVDMLLDEMREVGLLNKSIDFETGGYVAKLSISITPKYDVLNVKVNDTNRISPDDIGNDIHEFLHGGDK